MDQNEYRAARLLRDTKVLYRIEGTSEYLMTNDTREDDERIVFSADINGKISMEGLSLGSVYTYVPEIIPRLQEMNCTYQELAPAFFDRDPVVDGLMGLAVADAFGVPVEFLSRQRVREIALRDMVGNDCELNFTSRWSKTIPKGAWSDDTSLTIAAMVSIFKNNGQIDYENVMKQFCDWWDIGKFLSLPFAFGLGWNIHNALERYRKGCPALQCGGTGFMDNGNGALMRMFPFSIYCILNDYSDESTLETIRCAAGLTHRHEINALGCYMYTMFLRECLRTHNPVYAYKEVFYRQSSIYRRSFSEESIKAYDMLLNEDFTGDFDPDRVPETGYVVDSLTTAVYSVVNTNNYEDAIMLSMNFGYDTDTNGAITGSIAGAMYGREQIPERWLNELLKKEALISLGEQFSESIHSVSKQSVSM